MEVTARLLDAVPAGNLSVPRAAFGAVWTLAERRAASPCASDFLAGVVVALRWIAGAPAASIVTGRLEPPRSPVIGREVRAEPETIVQEVAAGAREHAHANGDRKTYLRGVIATFDWAWNGSGEPPVEESSG